MLGIVASMKERPSYPLCWTMRCQSPRCSFSFCPCVFEPLKTTSDKIQPRIFGVLPPSTLCGRDVFKMIRSYVSARMSVPSSLHNWLSHCTPVPDDHFNTACSLTTSQHSRTCLPPSLGFAELLMIAFVPIPYLATSIHVCSAQDRGTVIRPHQVVFEEGPTSLHLIPANCCGGIAQARWEEMEAACCADAVASQKRWLYWKWDSTSH